MSPEFIIAREEIMGSHNNSSCDKRTESIKTVDAYESPNDFNYENSNVAPKNIELRYSPSPH